MPAGVTPESLWQFTSACLLGFLVAVVIAFLLWRIFAYASGARTEPR